jgi:hypothetical protein
MAYLKRVFLNPIAEGAPSFIQAVAEDSDEGTHKIGNYLLIIADCERRIMLKFHVSSPRSRKWPAPRSISWPKSLTTSATP